MLALMKPCKASLWGLFWHWLLAGLLTPTFSMPLCGRSLSLIPPGCSFLKQGLLWTLAKWRLLNQTVALFKLSSFWITNLCPAFLISMANIHMCGALNHICWFASWRIAFYITAKRHLHAHIVHVHMCRWWQWQIFLNKCHTDLVLEAGLGEVVDSGLEEAEVSLAAIGHQ